MRLIIFLFLIGAVISFLTDSNEGEHVMAIAWWIPMALGALHGQQKAKKSREYGKEHDKFRRAAIQYSPWTNMSDPGGVQTQGDLEGIIGGGAGGLMLGAGIDKVAGGELMNWGKQAAETAGSGAEAIGAAGMAPPNVPIKPTPQVPGPVRPQMQIPQMQGQGPMPLEPAPYNQAGTWFDLNANYGRR